MGKFFVFMAYLADLPCFAPQTMTDTPSKQSVHSDGTILQSDSSSYHSDEETGAPVEVVSPLGYHVDWISVIFLVSSQEKIMLHVGWWNWTECKQDNWYRSVYYSWAQCPFNREHVLITREISRYNTERSRKRGYEFDLLGSRISLLCWYVSNRSISALQ